MMRTCVVSDSVHVCEEMCHEGPCGPCSLTSTVRCRCGSKTKVGGKTRRAELDASFDWLLIGDGLFIYLFSGGPVCDDPERR